MFLLNISRLRTFFGICRPDSNADDRLDPITFETMKHPIACSDGRRYSQTTLQKLQRNAKTHALVCPFTRQDMHIIDPKKACLVQPNTQARTPRRQPTQRMDAYRLDAWQRPLCLSQASFTLADAVVRFQRQTAQVCKNNQAFVSKDIFYVFGVVDTKQASSHILSFLYEHQILFLDPHGNYLLHNLSNLTLHRLESLLSQTPLLSGDNLQTAVDVLGVVSQELNRQIALQDYVEYIERSLTQVGWYTDPTARANQQDELQHVVSYRDLLPSQLHQRSLERLR